MLIRLVYPPDTEIIVGFARFIFRIVTPAFALYGDGGRFCCARCEKACNNHKQSDGFRGATAQKTPPSRKNHWKRALLFHS